MPTLFSQDIMSYLSRQAEETAEEIDLIHQRVDIELKEIQTNYKRRIVASAAVGYISMAFMIALPLAIVLNDLSKLHRKNSKDYIDAISLKE